MKTHIPISDDPNNWWQKGRILYLNYLLKSYKTSSSLKILEIGPGYGVNLDIISQYGEVDVLETEEYFLKFIKTNKKKLVTNYYKNIKEIDAGKYDVIIMLDVLEHIHEKEIKNFMKTLNSSLREKGYLIISVPAYQSLFSEMDEKVNHYRRYSWGLLNTHLYNQFEQVKIFGFNYFLLPVRYFQVKFLKKTKESVSVSKILNLILYLVLLFEFILHSIFIRPKFGISYFLIAKKKNNTD